MKKNKIKRFITVTGAGLKIEGDPYSYISNISQVLFNVLDPDRMSDAKNQQQLIEQSNLDWTVVRTPIHNSKDNKSILHIGFTQPQLWKTISRVAISMFILDCIEKNQFIKKAPIIY